MKKQNILEFYLFIIMAFTLLLSAAMLSGCEAFAFVPEDGTPTLGEGADTFESGGDALDASAPDQAEQSPEDDEEKGINYAVGEIFKMTQTESKEFHAKSIRGTSDYRLPNESLLVTFKGGVVFAYNTTYDKVEYVTGQKSGYIGDTFYKLGEQLSDQTAFSAQMLDVANDITEYYLLTSSENEYRSAIILSVDDTVYMLIAGSGTLGDIYTFDSNSEYIPTVPSDDKYNGEKNYVIKSLLEKANEASAEFQADTYLQDVSLSWMYSLNIKFDKGNAVCLNDSQKQVSYETDYSITISDFIRMDANAYARRNADKSYQAMMETLNKIEEIGEYYVVQGPSSDYGSPVVMCSIGDTCYVLSVYDGKVIRIHYFTLE